VRHQCSCCCHVIYSLFFVVFFFAFSVLSWSQQDGKEKERLAGARELANAYFLYFYILVESGKIDFGSWLLAYLLDGGRLLAAASVTNHGDDLERGQAEQRWIWQPQGVDQKCFKIRLFSLEIRTFTPKSI
jgi:hypothetical protein